MKILNTKEEFLAAVNAYRERMNKLQAEGKLTISEQTNYRLNFETDESSNYKFHENRAVEKGFIVCNTCGQPEGIGQYSNRPEESMLCHTCSFWADRIESIDSGHLMIANSQAYVAKPGKNPNSDRSVMGHGGRPLKFTSKVDGSSVISNDVWCSGEVPHQIMDMYGDSHTIEEIGAQEYADWYFSDEEYRKQLALRVVRECPQIKDADEALFHLSYCFWSVPHVKRRAFAPEVSTYQLKEYKPDVLQEEADSDGDGSAAV